jgi:ribosomal protein S18 acetylase RimI-like enzyme
MMNVNLRKATTDDSEFAYETKKAAFRSYVEMVWGWNEAEQRQMHERRYVNQFFQVVQVSDTDVGILATVQEPDCIKVNQLFILPPYQGKGIGEACMMKIIADSKQNHRPIRLSVLKVNTRAASFYHRLGFVKTGENDTHIMMERLP